MPSTRFRRRPPPEGSSPDAAKVAMTRDDFDQIREVVHDSFGISLSTAKFPLVRARLQGILRERRIESASEYIDQFLAKPSAEAMSELADAITTNHTYFWRENAHFTDLLERVIPEWMRKRAETRAVKPSLRIWCAAASTGQEPYTLAALVRLGLGSAFDRWDTGVLATDISARALDVARRGVYSSAEVQPLPERVRRALFDQRGSDFDVRQDIRSDVLYRRLNLLGEWKFRQNFEVIFARNVMIYFNEETRMHVARALAKDLRPGGTLYVGLSESLGPNPPGLKAVAPAIYRRTDEVLP
ncbi:MAG: protein-glutamate O-methyltransferase CheR [Myxococcales bacterium]|nr:protein-glutamate O-methyltransferase CheR [Myxococcales bacterium]MCB9731658.1 protein-glutamate O-methyltransferase CheR [Deltaproteobacteria bacterium]